MVDRLLVIDDAKDVQDLISYCARRNWPQAEVDWYDPVAKGKPGAGFDWSVYDFIFLDAHFGATGRDGLGWLKEFSRDGKLPPVIVLTDQVSEDSSAIARKLGAKAAHSGFLHRANDFWMRMPGDHGSPGADVIDIAAVICIDEIGAFAALEENGITTNGAKSPYR